jgi:hypothetical protein
VDIYQLQPHQILQALNVVTLRPIVGGMGEMDAESEVGTKTLMGQRLE